MSRKTIFAIWTAVLLAAGGLVYATTTYNANESMMYSTQTDDTAWTPAGTQSAVQMAGFEADEVAPDSVTEGDAGAGRISLNRMQLVQIGDGAGNERRAYVDASGQLSVTMGTGAGAILVDDAAFTPATSKVDMIGCEFDDATPDTVNEGDAAAIRCSASRALYTSIKDGAGGETWAGVSQLAGSSTDIDELYGLNTASLVYARLDDTTAASVHGTILGTATDDIDANQVLDTASAVFGRVDADSVNPVAANVMASISDDIDGNIGLNVAAALYGRSDADTLLPITATSTGLLKVSPVAYQMDDDAGNCEAITNASVQRTLVANKYYMFCADGGTAYVLCAANPTATTTVTTGFQMIVQDGMCRGPYRISSAKCAIIGAATAGNFCYHELDPS
jgi:hypothetical protein